MYIVSVFFQRHKLISVPEAKIDKRVHLLSAFDKQKDLRGEYPWSYFVQPVLLGISRSKTISYRRV